MVHVRVHVYREVMVVTAVAIKVVIVVLVLLLLLPIPLVQANVVVVVVSTSVADFVSVSVPDQAETKRAGASTRQLEHADRIELAMSTDCKLVNTNRTSPLTEFCVSPFTNIPPTEQIAPFLNSDHLAGLVVQVSASRAEDPVFESRWRRDFSGVEPYQ